MAKYRFEFKKKVVQAYLEREGGTSFLSKKYGLSETGNDTMLRKWISAYKKWGDEGLLRARKRETYSFEFKRSMVELYLTSEHSYQELAIQNGMNNPTLIAKWVNNFRIAGPDALRPKKKGRKKTVTKTPKDKKIQEIENPEMIDTSAEHVKELEDELLKLRIENAYLKELRRLRLEEEALLKKQRERSTVSGETSN